MSWGLDHDDFQEIAENRRGSIKGLLTNQKVIAGIGNVYADEILLQAKVHPNSQVSAMSKKDLENIFDSMKEVLEESGTDEDKTGLHPLAISAQPAPG